MTTEHDHWVVLDQLECGTKYLMTEKGKHPKDCGHPAVRVKKLKRAPTEHDTFDGKDLIHCQESKARAEYTARLAHMSTADLIDFIMQLCDERFEAKKGTTQ